MKTRSSLFCLLFAVCTNINITVKAQAVDEQDSLALVDFYNSTDAANWVDKTNWLTGIIKTWHGITVTGTRVTKIVLAGNNLNGTLPSSFGNLTGLNYLNLSSNYISGSIPSSFGNLVNLEYLYLIADQLTGTIPSSLGNLVKLKELSFMSNQLSGNIPREFRNLISLTYLDLGENKLSGTIPDALGTLPSLANLNLFYNCLTGTIPSTLGNLVHLQSLILNDNQLSGIIPSSLGTLSNLSGLYLSNNSLTGAIPASFGNLIHLQALDLSNNQLSYFIPSSLGNLINLYDLYLNNNLLIGYIPSSLLNLKSLIRADLSHNKLRGHLIRGIGNLTNLYSLNLRFNKLNGDISSAIANLPLSALDISHNHFTFNGMELIAQKFPFARYNNQARIPVHHNGNSLAISAGGTLSNNTYYWHKVRQTEAITIRGDSVFYPSQSGQYYVRVTNKIAYKLTLNSDTVNFVLADVAKTFASSANEIKLNEKQNMFSVYPNPAKDILYIQTNSKATFTLTNQSGKTLLTKTINVKGEINVANLVAGLYYLKNNATGAVQKIGMSK